MQTKEHRPLAGRTAGVLVVLLVLGIAGLGAGAATRRVSNSPKPKLVLTASTEQVGTTAGVPGTSDGGGDKLTDRGGGGTVDFFGDSLGYQAEPYLDMFFAEGGHYTVSNNTYGGTATCDWLSRMAAAATERPQAAILVFSGNAFTPCMEGAALESPEYYDLYSSYTEQAIGIFSAVGTHVFLVGTPIDESSGARLDDLYQRLAQANPLAVTYVNAGAAVETPAGRFTFTLPCLSIEPSCGANGTNVVRSPDGIHFCPDGTPADQGVTGSCDVYSPGAFRFALSMVTAVTQHPSNASASLVGAVR